MQRRLAVSPNAVLGRTAGELTSDSARPDARSSGSDALERYARAFDEISRESDAHYSARSFVRWVRLEATAPTYGQRGTTEGQEAA